MVGTALPASGLELSTGLPLWGLLPLIMVIAIAAVVGIRWLYMKLNKN